MKIQITRIDKTLPLPEYHTGGAVAFDIYSREEISIAPKTLGFIPTNFIIGTPPGYMLLLASRSGTPKKKGLMMANGIGIIDQDYCGPEDELKLCLYNFTDSPVTVERGERVGQGTFLPIERAEWEEVEKITEESRGGFGSSGTHVN